MEFILSNIKSNQTKRLEFLKNFDKIQNKAKKFDIPTTNKLYTKETLQDDSLFTETPNFDKAKYEILDYNYFYNRPIDYSKKDKDGVSAYLYDFFDVHFKNYDYSDDHANYPKYQPNQNAINLLNLCIDKLKELNFTIHQVKVDMNQYQDGHCSSVCGGCDPFWFACSYKNYRFIVEFADDCDIPNGMLIIRQVYNTNTKEYYECYTDLNGQNTSKSNLTILKILLECQDKNEFFQKVYQPYLDLKEYLISRDYIVECQFDVEKWKNENKIFINNYDYNFVMKVKKYNQSCLLLPLFKNQTGYELFITHSMNDNKEKYLKNNKLNSYYTSVWGGEMNDFKICINTFSMYYREYGLFLEFNPNNKVNIVSKIDEYNQYIDGKHINNEIENVLKNSSEYLKLYETAEEDTHDTKLIIKYEKLSNLIKPFKWGIVVIIGENDKAIKMNALNFSEYFLDYIIYEITTYEENGKIKFNLKRSYYVRDMIGIQKQYILEGIANSTKHDKLVWEDNRQFGKSKLQLLMENITFDLNKIKQIIH
jgi:hypothetical protein